MEKFIGKVFINAVIEIETGLHIGGSRESLEIGGLDNPVIKTVNGIPYIPGSSIKGKMRCSLERADGIKENRRHGEPCGCGKCNVCLLFGSATTDEKKRTITRLSVRDSFLDLKYFKEKFPELYGREVYTEEKTENVIDRIKGTAQHPRVMERVPAGSRFTSEIVISFYENDDIESLLKTFIQGLRLLEDEYLGGSGTRGYGKISFKNLVFSCKKKEDYQEKNQRVELSKFDDSTFDMEELAKKIEQFLGVTK